MVVPIWHRRSWAYVVVAVWSFASATQTVSWFTFGSADVTDVIIPYIPALSEYQILLLLNWGFILAPLGAILGTFLVEHYSYAAAYYVGSSLMLPNAAVCGVLATFPWARSSHLFLPFVHLAALCNGLALSCVVGACAAAAAVWFPTSGRGAAISTIVAFNNGGNMLSYTLSAAFVRRHDPTTFSSLLWLTFGAGVASVLIAPFIPPWPPKFPMIPLPVSPVDSDEEESCVAVRSASLDPPTAPLIRNPPAPTPARTAAAKSSRTSLFHSTAHSLAHSAASGISGGSAALTAALLARRRSVFASRAVFAMPGAESYDVQGHGAWARDRRPAPLPGWCAQRSSRATLPRRVDQMAGGAGEVEQFRHPRGESKCDGCGASLYRCQQGRLCVRTRSSGAATVNAAVLAGPPAQPRRWSSTGAIMPPPQAADVADHCPPPISRERLPSPPNGRPPSGLEPSPSSAAQSPNVVGGDPPALIPQFTFGDGGSDDGSSSRASTPSANGSEPSSMHRLQEGTRPDRERGHSAVAPSPRAVGFYDETGSRVEGGSRSGQQVPGDGCNTHDVVEEYTHCEVHGKHTMWQVALHVLRMYGRALQIPAALLVSTVGAAVTGVGGLWQSSVNLILTTPEAKAVCTTTSTEIQVIGLVSLAACFAGGLLAGVLMFRFPRWLKAILVGQSLCCALSVLYASWVVQRPDLHSLLPHILARFVPPTPPCSFLSLLMPAIIVGVMVGISGPVSCEMAVELVYPEPESVATEFFTVLFSIVSSAFLFIPNARMGIMTINVRSAILLTLASGVAMLTPMEYKRSNALITMHLDA